MKLGGSCAEAVCGAFEGGYIRIFIIKIQSVGNFTKNEFLIKNQIFLEYYNQQ